MKRNRGALPPHPPRIEVIVDVEDKACPCCGGTTHVLGEDRAEMLDYAPAQVRVKVIRRPKRGCRACEGAVLQALAPDRPIDGGMATEALLAHILISKYGDSLPLYRQAQIFARQGVILDRSTLCDWVGRACWWLAPLHELMMTTELASPKIFTDDTTLPVLDPGRGRTKTGRLWCYAVDALVWAYRMHTSARHVLLRPVGVSNSMTATGNREISDGVEPGTVWAPAPGKKGAFLPRRLVEVGMGGVRLRPLGGDRAGEVGLGRFLRNPTVTPDEIISTACARTVGSVRGRHMLVPQDTTSLCDDGDQRSLQLHPAIAVDAEDGALVGLVYAEFLYRAGGVKAKRKRLPFH